MPNLTSSFASAASGQSQNGTRGAPAAGDWASRRDGRSLNGTRTFRRPTTTTPSGQLLTSNVSGSTSTPLAPGSSIDNSNAAGSSVSATATSNTTSGVSFDLSSFEQPVPPAPARYGRDDILDVYRGVDPGTAFSGSVAQALYMDGWAPGQSNGNNTATVARQWGKTSDSVGNIDPNMCWTSGVQNGFKPLGLQDMTVEEKEAFSNDVNSPLKLITTSNTNINGPNATKDAQGTIANGRKISANHLSTNQGSNAFGLASPTSRLSPRRRESGDQFGSSAVNSPQTSRFARDDSSWLGNRSKMSELRESSTIEGNEDDHDDIPVPQSARDAPKMGFFGMPVGGKAPGTAGGVSLVGGAAASGWPATPSGQNTPSIGAFGSFALPGGALGGPSHKQSSNSQSRLVHLLPTTTTNKESEGGGAVPGNQPKTGTPGSDSIDGARSWRRPRTDTDPFSDSGRMGGGGASLIGGSRPEDSPPLPTRSATQPFETPHKSGGGIGLGVSDLGMNALNLGNDVDSKDFSPSLTNPYRSPAGADRERIASDDTSHHDDFQAVNGNIDRQIGGSGGGTIGGFDQAIGGFGATRGAFPGAANGFDASDRSQTSSVGPKGYPGLGNISGWPGAAPGPGVSTPGGSNFGGAFGSVFAPMDMQGTPFGGNVFGQPPSGPGAIGTPSIGRRSKLEALFPQNLQSQMQNPELDESEMRQGTPGGLSSIGRGFPTIGRDTDSPINASRTFGDLFAPPTASPGMHIYGGHDSSSGNLPGGMPSGFGGLGTAADRQPPTGSNASRQMVMPDRMRWVYLDPQGQVQGPFTGLEMNDWYKANFFSPDLSVRRLEDTEFEALGSLIRRIGNSREPFLVPQIGIPHGSPQPGPFGQNPSGGVVPPLSSVIPTYGRTLTAEEQNNLERRKQEEQFVAAQQRDIFIRHQHSMGSKFSAYGTTLPGAPIAGNVPSVHGLHHHSSAHSLHSQPGFTNAPLGGPHPPLSGFNSFFDVNHPLGPGGPNAPGPIGLGSGLPQQLHQQPQQLQGDDTERHSRLNSPFPNVGGPLASGAPGTEVGSGVFGTQASAPQTAIAPPSCGLEASTSHGHDNLPAHEDLVDDEEGFKQRIQEFTSLRKNLNEQEEAERQIAQEASEAAQALAPVEQSPISTRSQSPEPVVAPVSASAFQTASRTVSRKTASPSPQREAFTEPTYVQEAPKPVEEDIGLPMPFPPPPGAASPEPRAALTPSQPPPLAPWAVEANASRKGPSLKEIQEAEAVKAAKAEKVAAAARRAAFEQEMIDSRERERVMASVQLGLPTTSTWGHATASPAATISSPWAKPVARASTGTPAPKSSNIAEIQREEEARKAAKAKELAKQQAVAGTLASALGSSSIPSTGKRYADLASKNMPTTILSVATVVGSPAGVSTVASPTITGWATVGAGGKVKTPLTAGSSTPIRAVSTSSSKPLATKPVAIAKSIVSAKSDFVLAQEEFNKWIIHELRDLDNSIDVDSFITNLKELGSEKGVIEDAIYSSSKTMDGRHFAEEFVRRKKLADRGVVEKITPASGTVNASGWSEVAKKGGHGSTVRDQSQSSAHSAESSIAGATFKVVPGRKKNGKK